MADSGYSPETGEPGTQARQNVERRRGVDLLTMIAGVATLLVSGYLLSDGATWLPALDVRWVLAGSAVFVGVLMLAASLRGGRK